MKHLKRISIAVLSCLAMLATASCNRCASSSEAAGSTATNYIKPTRVFCADSAYSYIRDQVKFGPRVSGSEGNSACQKYIIDALKADSAVVTVQSAEVKAFNGDRLPICNILGSFNPDCNNRILLLAHYDTRPWSDNETDPAKVPVPVPGANDGASGVAVLLEIARQLRNNPPQNIGVDMLFVDAEDYGTSEGFSTNDESWCLGTQYWIRHTPYTEENKPRYCVVLDMVGGINARFHREYYSDQIASGIVDKIWSVAERSGFADRFVNSTGGNIIDCHVYINRIGIPAIDIIESRNEETRSFPPTWHRNNDNIQNIDKSSLNAVGQTVLNLIQLEK
ncbi:MAG: M28 family peptidase [Duncaniella sp.]|nr:M28 family peptidase [Duncaniella sp.]